MRVGSTTFAGGIIGPGLWGRVDLNKYQTGAADINNMIVAVEGGLEKRLGSYLVGERMYNLDSKLVPWRLAADDSYVLEFFNEGIRFIRFGGFVDIPGGHAADPDNMAVQVAGKGMVVPTPYTSSEVWELKFTYANDIMYIFHPSHGMKELRRLGLYDWNLSDSDFAPHPAFSGVVTATWVNDLIVPDDNYVPEAEVLSYMVSATLSNGIETLPSPVVYVSADLGHRRLRVELDWDDQPDAIQYTIYKGANGVYGFIGYSIASEYIDRNYAPSYEIVPVNNFWTFGGEYPRVGDFYKQRMVYGGTNSKRQTLWLSKPLLFTSLAKSLPSQADDAIQVELVGKESHTINHMMELKKFIIFTDTAEWVLGTVDGQAMSAASINPVPETWYGADPNLKPIAIGDRILFVQNVSNAIRDMGYEFTSDSMKADDLSRLVRHLFKNKTVVAWAYAEHPHNILSVVFDDGSMGVMTYVREHEIWAWAVQETAGHYLDVVSVPEGEYHAIYYQVRRKIRGSTSVFMERLEVNLNGVLEDMVFMDSALTYKDDDPVALVSAVDADTVQFYFAAHPYAVGDELQLEVGSGDDRIVLRGVVGIGTNADNVILNLLNGDTVDPDTFEYDEGLVLYCTDTITGLGHFYLSDIWVLADGKVLKDIVVPFGGEVTLPFKVARAHFGLPYTAHMETLDLDIDQAKGQYVEKTIDEIILRLRASRGVWAGPKDSEQDLVNLDSRSDEEYDEAPRVLDGPIRLSSHISWSMTAGVRVESRDPLPLNILNIVPDLIYGED